MSRHIHVYSDPVKSFDGCGRPYVYYQKCTECGQIKHLGYSQEIASHSYLKTKRVRLKGRLYTAASCQKCGYIHLQSIPSKAKKQQRTLLYILASIMSLILILFIAGIISSKNPATKNPAQSTTKYYLLATEGVTLPSSRENVSDEPSSDEETFSFSEITDSIEITSVLASTSYIEATIAKESVLAETTSIAESTNQTTVFTEAFIEAETSADIKTEEATEPITTTQAETETTVPVSEIRVTEASTELITKAVTEVFTDFSVDNYTKTPTESPTEKKLVYPISGMIYTGSEVSDYINSDYVIYIYIGPLHEYYLTEKSEEAYIPSSDSFICKYEPCSEYLYGFYKF